MPGRTTQRHQDGEPAPPRLVVTDVTPQIEGGRYPVKRVVGEPVTVGAAVYADGHDHLWCVVAHRPPGARGWTMVPMDSVNPGLDWWEATFLPEAVGEHRYRVLGWIDPFGSWRAATRRKIEAGVDVASDLLAGAAVLEELAATAPRSSVGPLREAASRLRAGEIDPVLGAAEEADELAAVAHGALRPGDAVVSKPTLTALVEPTRALFNAWYELFPRSWSAAPHTDGAAAHGTLADVEARLDYVAGMGFDVLYLPPIHPIGTSFRKGPDNAGTAGPADPGSPWAIGGPEGGHTAVHPALGTVDDLRHLVSVARRRHLDVALDIAFQCSPDHPWVAEHPEWFRHRPDGTIQYAENPPKKYQDIYPLDFDSKDWRALWDALLDVFLFWARQGVTTFRVDNPHTKPFAFWEWVIAEVRTRHPAAVFLSEAFTRPRVMHRLGQVGFTLSYSYFPWRQSKGEIVDYFVELASPPSVDELRPSCWPNTPDILTRQLWEAPLTLFASRVFLAATLSPSYGIYGPAFELGENKDAQNGKEEYLHSEKYEVRRWDLDDPTSLRPLIADLNRIRRRQTALHTLRTLRFHETSNDSLVAFSKTPHAGPSVDPGDEGAATVLVVANLDGSWRQGGFVDLDLGALGVDPGRPFVVHDLLGGGRFQWAGSHSYVELDPSVQPGHIFRVEQD